LDSFEPIPPEQLDAPAPQAVSTPANRAEDPPWNLLHVLLVVGLGIPALFVATIIATVVALAVGIRSFTPAAIAQNIWIGLLAQALAYVLLIAAIVVIVSQRSRESFWKTISWNAPDTRRSILAVLSGAVLGVTSLVFSGLLQRWIPKSLPIDQMFQNAKSAYALAAFGVFIAPAAEELFFRGLLYPALARKTGIPLAVFLTAASFAAIHGIQLAWAVLPVLFIFAVGMVLTVARAWSKSLAVTVLIHMAYNATLFLALFIATQGFRHMERAQ
jgi:membrane protease YdiL (CAAX protease family)